jgi:hypothetical protein
MTTSASVLQRAVMLARSNGIGVGYATADGINPLTTTAGGTLTLIDTSYLPPLGATDLLNKEWFIYLPDAIAADRKRIIESYSPTSREFTLAGPNYATATINQMNAGATYLVLMDDPDDWASAITEAVRNLLSEPIWGFITPTVDRQVLYPLAAFTDITRRTQVFDLEVCRASEPTDERNWLPWYNGQRTWEVQQDGEDLYINFEWADYAPTTADLLRLTYLRQFDPADGDWDFDELWAALAVLVTMADWNADPTDSKDRWFQIGRKVNEAYVGRKRAILGGEGFRVVSRTSQQTGLYGVRGRRGGWLRGGWRGR